MRYGVVICKRSPGVTPKSAARSGPASSVRPGSEIDTIAGRIPLACLPSFRRGAGHDGGLGVRVPVNRRERAGVPLLAVRAPLHGAGDIAQLPGSFPGAIPAVAKSAAGAYVYSRNECEHT
jgi:hypothetical protein